MFSGKYEHGGDVPFVYITNNTLYSFNTFIGISVATNVTACKVHETRANQFHNMRHRKIKSTPVAKKNVPITEKQQHAKGAMLSLHRLPSNIRWTFYCNNTRMSCDIGC